MVTVLTMADKAYLSKCDSLLQNKCGHSVILSTPDKIDSHIGAHVIEMDRTKFYYEMQRLKFEIMLSYLRPDSVTNLAFLDMDTFIRKPLDPIFDYDFDVAITVRKDMIKKGCYRAFANGGAFFAKNTIGAYNFFKFALHVIDNYGGVFRFYDDIFKTLENGRPEDKTHYRHNKRWWCDQVFLSSVVSCFKAFKVCEPNNFFGMKVLFLDCEEYNQLEVTPEEVRGDPYIGHLKSKGGTKELKD